MTILQPFSSLTTRREALIALAGLGVAGGALAVSSRALAQSPVCVLTPEISEGPFYFSYGGFREDVTDGKSGAAMRISFAVIDTTTCAAIPNALVDLWQCDAGGEYSGYSDAALVAATTGPVGPDGPPHRDPDTKTTYLRGTGVTNSNGGVRFKSIYPGWYDHRAVHAHVKVHVGGKVVHTGQIFFPDTITDRVYQTAPYALHTGNRVRNTDDKLFQRFGESSTFALDTKDDVITASAILGLRRL